MTIVCVAALTMALQPVAGNEEADGRYVLPSHGATACPTGVTNLDPICVGGVIVKSPSGAIYGQATAKVIDDVFGENVAYTLCVGDDDNLQGCTPGDFVCGPDSIATDTSAVPHSTVNVFILSIFVPEDGSEPCIGTAGTAHIVFG